jgi:uncharacterized SAM-binding protein YcdF (DUF218 family)
VTVLRRLLVLVLVVGFAALVAVGAGRRLGRWLVVADPLERVPVVAVMAGDAPFRAMEAARLLREGWASEVWLTRASLPAREAALARLGIRFVGDDDYNRQALQRLGVPASAVRVIPLRVESTAREVEAIAAELRRRGVARAIVVTSRAHTRRVRATWQAVVGDVPGAIVRPTQEDASDLERWWRRKRDAKTVSNEWFGLLNVWVGFPLRPDSE